MWMVDCFVIWSSSNIFSIHESVHKSAQQETCNNTTLNSLNSHEPHQFPSQGGISVGLRPGIQEDFNQHVQY